MKTMENMAEDFKKMMPQVNFNKNGYEIRTQMLEMAQTQVWQDFHAKWGQFETSIKKDNSTVVTRVTMPEIPNAEQVLETAEKFYSFVNNNTK